MGFEIFTWWENGQRHAVLLPAWVLFALFCVGLFVVLVRGDK